VQPSLASMPTSEGDNHYPHQSEGEIFSHILMSTSEGDSTSANSASTHSKDSNHCTNTTAPLSCPLGILNTEPDYRQILPTLGPTANHLCL